MPRFTIIGSASLIGVVLIAHMQFAAPAHAAPRPPFDEAGGVDLREIAGVPQSSMLERRAPPGSASCEFKPRTPSAPADVSVAKSDFHEVVVYGRYVQIFFYRNVGDDKRCVAIEEVTIDDFYSNKQTQDVVGRARVVIPAEFAVPNPRAPLSDVVEAAAALKAVRGFFVVARATSRFNDDTALLVAAARPAPEGSGLTWQLFRIQLTEAASDTHFCTPTADVTVLNPRIGTAPAGRLFIAFDTFEGFTNPSGSLLDIDARSLLSGGPARVKCFTGKKFQAAAPPDIRDAGRNAYVLAAPLIGNAIKRFRLRIADRVADDAVFDTPDIGVPDYTIPPAAVQPNGQHLWAGGSEFRLPSIQVGNLIWNVHTVDDGNDHPKVRLYGVSSTATVPFLTLTLKTRRDGRDDLLAPSLDVESAASGQAFVTFTRTVAASPTTGKATLMMARGPRSSATGWTTVELAASRGQFSRNSLGTQCDPFPTSGCQYGSDSATVIDAENRLIWGYGEVITTGSGARAGFETNWRVRGIGIPR